MSIYCTYETLQTPAAADAEERTLKAKMRRQQKTEKRSRNVHLPNATASLKVAETELSGRLFLRVTPLIHLTFLVQNSSSLYVKLHLFSYSCMS